MSVTSTKTAKRSRLETLFGENGPLKKQWPNFVPRPQQVALALAVENALYQNRPCLAEAGTGVGKTLAYLIPLVHWLAKDNKRRAIVSTHTLALQAQLVERDIPNLMAALPDLAIRPATLKGRSNYLCLQDLDIASGELWASIDPQFVQIRRWANETETGDMAELDFSFPYWSDIAANQDTCRGRECRFFPRCFYYKARKNAEDANLIVVNHALFFTDLRLRREMPGMQHLLPEYEAVVFDEAHHIEDMAMKAFGLEWGSRRVPTLLARARRVPGIEPESLSRLEQQNEYFLTPFLNAHKSEAFMDEALPNDSDQKHFVELRDELASRLRSLATELTKIADNSESVAEKERSQGLARLASRTAAELQLVTKPEVPPATMPVSNNGTGVTPVETTGNTPKAEDDVPYFRWFQTRRGKNGQIFSTLVRTPIEIGPLLQDALYRETPRVICVSATLASGGNFTYLKQRLGMGNDAPSGKVTANGTLPEPIETRQGSPFDFEKNCLLYIPRTLGQPTGGYKNNTSDAGGDDYTQKLTAEIQRLIEAAKGRTFVLFTSYRMLRAVEERLQAVKLPYPLFVQGEMPNGRLVESFIRSGQGVLLGTSSFWEGVDVSGPALSCVILDKLPFPTPDTPLQRAREQAIKERGGDTFREWSLPQTQIRLKQGFGRLLRTLSDRGVVAILDERLWTKSYGRQLLNDLPPCPRTEHFAEVANFLAAL